MRRGKPHQRGRCSVWGDAEGAKTSWEESSVRPALLLAEAKVERPQPRLRGGGPGWPLGVWRTLKESVSPWEEAEAVETQPGSRIAQIP
jgi:hypothetical protein